MKGELSTFVLSRDLSPFSTGKSLLKSDSSSIFKTRDAKSVYSKVLSQLSSKFVFKETANLWHCFPFTSDFSVVSSRQKFFSSLQSGDASFLKRLTKPVSRWRPRYDIIVVTEDESTFVELNKLNCAVQLLVSESDVLDLESYDIVQVVDCPTFHRILESLPQSIMLSSVDDAYLERYLEDLSGWRDNYAVLKSSPVSSEIKNLLVQLDDLFSLLDNEESSIISESQVEAVLEDINDKVSSKVKDLTISGEGLLKMLGEGKMPPVLLDIVRSSVESSGFSEHIFNLQIPVTIDYAELESQIKRQSASEFTDLAVRVKHHADRLRSVPHVLSYLSSYLLVEDFCFGVSSWIGDGKVFPSHSSKFEFVDASNMFLSSPQPISFVLDDVSRCSILTGANSGGKTTLLEHLLQGVSLFHLGLPVSGSVSLPLFSDVYYFAKNKGSASKGAFETLLSQMSKITPGSHTLILADEIEAVTEPGVAGKIISSTADFFVRKGCFVVLATHLGYEIQKSLPSGARIDGIEAKGLDDDFNLIVDHNPVLGRLAHSTPELIVERMAKSSSEEYFSHLYNSLKK